MSSAKLVYEGKEYELPVVEGTENEKAIVITELRKQTGLITLDSGYSIDARARVGDLRDSAVQATARRARALRLVPRSELLYARAERSEGADGPTR